jgi:hypothetical protein
MKKYNHITAMGRKQQQQTIKKEELEMKKYNHITAMGRKQQQTTNKEDLEMKEITQEQMDEKVDNIERLEFLKGEERQILEYLEVKRDGVFEAITADKFSKKLSEIQKEIEKIEKEEEEKQTKLQNRVNEIHLAQNKYDFKTQELLHELIRLEDDFSEPSLTTQLHLIEVLNRRFISHNSRETLRIKKEFIQSLI